MVLATLLAVLGAGAGASTREGTRSSEGGEVLLSVHAEAVPLSELLAEIGFRTGRTLESGEALPDALLTVDLVRRPLDQVVHTVSGAAGLRGRATASALVVELDIPLGAAPDELDQAAEVHAMRALRRFPDHALAPGAELMLGEIQEDRGRLDAAHDHYDLLVQRHRRSPLAPEALWRSARILQRLGRWSEAWAELSALLNRSEPHPYRAAARFELARTSVELGDPQQAEYLIDALDRDLPADTRAELRRRLALRASITLANGNPNETLRTLDQVDRMGSTEVDAELEGVRARALEAAGRPAEAGRAWLVAAGAALDDAFRKRALRDAARLAFEAGDDLAVLFVDRHARGLGLGAIAEPWPSRARERLGMSGSGAGSALAEDGLARVEALLAGGLWRDAFDASGGLLADPSAALDDELRLRAVLARAHAAQQLVDAESALDVLREHLNDFERIDERRGIYLRAGELLEHMGRFDEAADAYGGKL
jgi:tetratricopeptide (TPR) repeat protein